MPGSVALATLLEARSARVLDVRADGAVLIASDLTGSLQLYRTDLEGAPLHRITDLPEPVGAALFIPGTRDLVLAVDSGGDECHQLHTVADTGGTLADLVVEPGVKHNLGAVSPDGGAVAYTSTRRDGVGFDVMVRDLATGEERLLLEGGYQEVEAWSPDGRRLAVVRHGGLALNTDILVVDVESGESRLVTPHEGSAASWGCAFVPRAGRTPLLLFTTDIDRDASGIAAWDPETGVWEYVLEPGWECVLRVTPGWSTAVLAVNDDGRTRLLRCRLDPTSGRPTPEGDLRLPGAGVAWYGPALPPPVALGDGTAVATYTAAGRPAEVHRVSGDAAPVLLVRCPSDVPEALRRDPDLVRIPSFDGVEVPLFVYRPPGPGPHPTLLWIHGGPESQFVPSFNPVILHLLDAGIAVVAPNVRGSSGYGKRYVHLDDVRLRLDSVRDLAAIHAALGGLGLDPARAALMGGSYGGYMTLAGLAFQPELWAAGVSLVGISSLVTFLENTSPYRRHVREVEYGSLEHDRDFLVEASPLTHVERMRAPLMLLHGANDPRVPVSEARQLHDALRSRGVPAELVVYDDEGHGLQKLKNRLDAYPRVSAFLRTHLGVA